MKYFIVSILSLISCSTFSQQLSQEDSISLLLLNQQYEEAIYQCNAILHEDNTANWVWAPMGQAKLKLMRYKQALSNFKESEKYYPDNQVVKYAKAQAYSKLGDHAKASTIYQSIFENDSTQILARIELAKSYYSGQKYRMAIPVYLGLLEEDPGNYAFNKELGMAYQNIDSLKKAIWYMHLATNINNRDQGLIAKLTTLLNKEGDYAQALNVVKLGRMHDSTSTPLISLEGYCYYLLQNYKPAIDLFSLARSYGDSSVFTAKYLGISLIYNKEEKSAIPIMDKVFQADSTSNNCYYLGMAHHGIEQYDTALQYFRLTQELMEPTPTVVASVYKYIAGSLYFLGKYQKALDNYLLAYKFDPSEYTVLYNIGSVYDHYLNQKKKALGYYEKFLAKSGFEFSEEGMIAQDHVSISLVAYQRVQKIREDLHFEGELNK